MKKQPKIVTLKDVWAKRNGQSRIEVGYPGGKTAFPYGDSAERNDQLRNAKFFAQEQIDKKVALSISDETGLPMQRVRNIVVDGYIVEGTPLDVEGKVVADYDTSSHCGP